MLQGEKLRRADLVTSVLLIGFSLWMLFETLKMPMRDTFGGVQNVWYVSPGLFPLAISIALFVLGSMLLVHSIRAGAVQSLRGRIAARLPVEWEPIVRFGAILLAFFGYVYLTIPRVDFFLATSFFLLYFVSAFHFDDPAIMRRVGALYAASVIAIYLVFVTGLNKVLNAGFIFTTDVIVLAMLISLVVVVVRSARARSVERLQIRLVMIITFATPLVLVPVFRYFLRVPLPREGGIIEIMHIIYYSLR